MFFLGAGAGAAAMAAGRRGRGTDALPPAGGGVPQSVFTIGPGRDFATLNAAAAARFPLQQTETWLCYGGANLVNGQLRLEGFNDFDLHIEAAPGHQYTWGEFDPSKAYLSDEGFSWSFGFIEPTNQGSGILYFKGLQTYTYYNATGNAVFKPYDDITNVGVNIIADNCYFRGIRGETSQTNARHHRVVAGGNVEPASEIILRNCVIDGFQSDWAEVARRGAGVHVFVNGPIAPVIWAVHCTFVRCDWAITTYTNEVVAQSNLAAQNREGGYAVFQDGGGPYTWASGCNNNISDDTDIPTGTGNLASQAVNFRDLANTDLRPADDGLDLGVDLSSYDYGEGRPLQVTTDLLGNPRTRWTAGAYEYIPTDTEEPAGFTQLIDDDFDSDFSQWTFNGGGSLSNFDDHRIEASDLVFEYKVGPTGTLQSFTSPADPPPPLGVARLAASASAVDDFYNKAGIQITGGTGGGETATQSKTIVDYVGASKDATLEDSPFAVEPDATSTYRIGFIGGTGPGRIVNSTNYGPVEYCLIEDILFSANWYGHPSSVNKIKYWVAVDEQHLTYLEVRGNGAGALLLGVTTQNEQSGPAQDVIMWNDARNLASPTEAQATVTRGVRHKIETLWYPGSGGALDGYVKVWLEGVLIIHVNNLDHSAAQVGATPATAIGAAYFDPVWGGNRYVVPATQSIRIGRIRVSYGSI